jgi:hypothetical protein
MFWIIPEPLATGESLTFESRAVKVVVVSSAGGLKNRCHAKKTKPTRAAPPTPSNSSQKWLDSQFMQKFYHSCWHPL